MCRGCDVEQGPGWGELWQAATPDERALQKNQQRVLFGMVSREYGVKVVELDGCDSFMISNQTGRSLVVYGVRNIWPAVEGLTGRAVDVLQARFCKVGKDRE